MAVILLSLLLLCGCGSSRPDQETGWEEAPQWKEGLPAQDPDPTPERVPQDLSQLDTTQYSGAFGSFATLTDPTSGVPVLDAVVPYDWSAWVETDWQVYSTLNPCIAYVFFQSPDGQATVMFQTAHNYLQMYDTPFTSTVCWAPGGPSQGRRKFPPSCWKPWTRRRSRPLPIPSTDSTVMAKTPRP